MSERDTVYEECERCAAVCRGQAELNRARAREADAQSMPQLAWAYRVAASALIQAEALIWLGKEGATGERQTPE